MWHRHFRRRRRVESAAARTRVAVGRLGAEPGIHHRVVMTRRRRCSRRRCRRLSILQTAIRSGGSQQLLLPARPALLLLPGCSNRLGRCFGR